jgi:putative restriction endonuclease
MASKDELARRIWPVLTALARSKRPQITYEQLAQRIGHGSAQLKWPLGVIQDYCEQTSRPPLTILVIGKKTRAPSSGFTAWDMTDIKAGLKVVREHSWEGENPFDYASGGSTIKALSVAVAADPSNAATVWTRVRSRGVLQIIFREAVRQAYSCCAFCGLTRQSCLQAAHIVPYAESDAIQSISLSNGLLLCANHHLMFDRHELGLRPDGKIEFAFLEAWLDYSETEKAATVYLHEKNALLPRMKSQRPSEIYLEVRYGEFRKVLATKRRKQKPSVNEADIAALMEALERTARGA